MSVLRIKYHKEQNMYGTSLIEVLLVVVIMLIILASAYPLGSGFLNRNKFKNHVNELTNSLRVAQLNSISGKEASNWGVSVSQGKITLFKGSSYAGRDEAYDEVYELSNDIYINPSTYEIVFDRLNGNPSQTVTFSITGSATESVIVSVNEVGVVDVN